MIARFNVVSLRLTTDDDGNMEAALAVSPDSRYAARQAVKTLKTYPKKEFTVKFDLKKNPRTLDQNALMWKLLTIYAEVLGGGRRGSVQPEDLYIRMLEKYGVAVFVMTLPEARPELEAAFRAVKEVDKRDYNGKELTVYKCYYGSSKYDTKDMSQLIDGIFDELAAHGVDVATSGKVAIYYEDWQKYKEAQYVK